MAGITGTRVDYDDKKPGKNLRTGTMSEGGPVPNERAQKPVKGGSSNASTINAAPSPKTTRPSGK